MKKILFVLLVCMLLPVKSFGGVLIFVPADAARKVLYEYFSMFNYVKVLQAYNEMLQQNYGLLSVDGLKHVCSVAFYNYLDRNVGVYMLNSFQKQQCSNFVKDLIEKETIQNFDCPYDISKVDASQMKIQYKNKKDNSGFINKDGSKTWRLNNPGALRRSSLACDIISTEQGDFAAFADEQTGMQALARLLQTAYANSTVKETIYKYAPPTDNNNTIKYINDLEKESQISRGRKISSLSSEELKSLVKTIRVLEGWIEGTVIPF